MQHLHLPVARIFWECSFEASQARVWSTSLWLGGERGQRVCVESRGRGLGVTQRNFPRYAEGSPEREGNSAGAHSYSLGGDPALSQLNPCTESPWASGTPSFPPNRGSCRNPFVVLEASIKYFCSRMALGQAT